MPDSPRVPVGGPRPLGKRRVSAYNLFQQTVTADAHEKFGGADAFNSAVRLRFGSRPTTDGAPRRRNPEALRCIAQMWKAAPDTVKEFFEHAADLQSRANAHGSQPEKDADTPATIKSGDGGDEDSTTGRGRRGPKLNGAAARGAEKKRTFKPLPNEVLPDGLSGSAEPSHDFKGVAPPARKRSSSRTPPAETKPTPGIAGNADKAAAPGSTRGRKPKGARQQAVAFKRVRGGEGSPGAGVAGPTTICTSVKATPAARKILGGGGVSSPTGDVMSVWQGAASNASPFEVDTLLLPTANATGEKPAPAGTGKAATSRGSGSSAAGGQRSAQKSPASRTHLSLAGGVRTSSKATPNKEARAAAAAAAAVWSWSQEQRSSEVMTDFAGDGRDRSAAAEVDKAGRSMGRMKEGSAVSGSEKSAAPGRASRGGGREKGARTPRDNSGVGQRTKPTKGGRVSSPGRKRSPPAPPSTIGGPLVVTPKRQPAASVSGDNADMTERAPERSGARGSDRAKTDLEGGTATTSDDCIFGLKREKKATIEVEWETETKLAPRKQAIKEKKWFSAAVDLIDAHGTDETGRWWNVVYQRQGNVPRAKSRIVFLSADKLRDYLQDWDEDSQGWLDEPLSWRPQKRPEEIQFASPLLRKVSQVF